MTALRMLRRPAFLVAIFIFVAGFGAAAADLLAAPIVWSADRPLTWADYRMTPPTWAGPPKTAAGASGTVTFTPAVTHVGIAWAKSARASSSGLTITARLVELTVTNTMDPLQSWALPAYVTPQILRHEQYHFNLHEVYRRLIQMTLAPLTVTRTVATPQDCTYDAALACAQALNDQANSIGMAILARASAAHAAYDADTKGGMDLTQQAAWEKKIDSLLLNPAAAP